MNEPTPDYKEENLHARLVSAIKTRIIQWDYPPGYRLLEQDVCREYEVSRSPAREALRTLEADGFLEKMPRKGYLIRQPSPRQARDMYEVRLALELFVIEHLAERGIDETRFAELAAPWRANGDHGQYSDEEFAELDRSFHESFATILGNEALIGHLGAIDERLHVFRIIEFANEETRQITCRQHLEILESVARRDVAGARAALRRNIETAIQHVQEAIKEALARSYLKQGEPWGNGAE
jgi:DNA-binding GntR family transcriptional regulator